MINEFDSLIDLDRNEEIEHTIIEQIEVETPEPVNTLNTSNMAKLRKTDKKATIIAALLGITWGHSYAADMRAASFMFNNKSTAKPKWAVVGCVLLRDNGICQICGQMIIGYKDWELVRLVPKKLGGGFHELNLVTICNHCAMCWNVQKNFFMGSSVEECFRKQKIYVLKRRFNNYKGCKGLSPSALRLWRELKSKQEREDIKGGDEVDKTKNIQKIKEILAGL